MFFPSLLLPPRYSCLDLESVCFFSVGELDKLYNVAANGSEEEKTAAAKILCGASLVRGWNIQVL